MFKFRQRDIDHYSFLENQTRRDLDKILSFLNRIFKRKLNDN